MRLTKHRGFPAIGAAVAIALSGFLLAGFGTIRGAGQDAEHGRITRHAVGCEAKAPIVACFESETLDSLAGAPGSFGAVGGPDRGRGMLTSYAHCSGGDYLAVTGYPRSRAEAEETLTACRDYMAENLSHAVEDAAHLLDDDGAIRSSQIPGLFSCTYVGSEHGRAKCNILADLGRVFHAGQDFYSHSNWVDAPDPLRPVSADNPPGLGNLGRAPWLDLRYADPVFPAGLISGCFDNASFLGEQRGCLYNEDRSHRVRHLNLNKDTGPIDPDIGIGSTERGALADNFARAVNAAIEDTADKWATFQERLVAAYGPVRAERMICAITHDDPVDDCA
jgi:predicted small secreted protein